MSYAEKSQPNSRGGAQYDDATELIVVPNQKNSYTTLYNRLYQLLKTGALDYTLLAQKTGFKERRIRDMLLFRLGSGEVRQLFGLQQGLCFLCSAPVLLPKEPMCLSCLERIDACNPPALKSADALAKATEGDSSTSDKFVLPYASPSTPLETEVLGNETVKSATVETNETTLLDSGFSDSDTSLTEAEELNDATADSLLLGTTPEADMFASLPTLPDPGNLFPYDPDESLSPIEEESVAALLRSSRPPRRYGFERVKPLR
jgi:hypothetical protein